MTPLSYDNAELGQIHYKDLVAMLKDGVYAKDRPCAHIKGLLLCGIELGIILKWEASLQQMAFVRGPKIRASHPNFGEPFLGPDGLVMKLGGRVLSGSEKQFDVSPLSIADVQSHPNYDT